MRDVFKEQLIKRLPNAKTTLIRVGIVLASLVLIVLSLGIEAISFFFPILLTAIIFGAYILMKRLNIEYEYVLTNNEMDIDIIYGKSRRKRIFSGNVRDFEAFRQVGSAEMEHTFSSAQGRADYTSGKGEGVYEFLAVQGGKKMRIIIEPNEELLASIIPYLKRGTFPAELLRRKIHG